MNTEELLREREEEYGEAWHIAGLMMVTFNDIIFGSNLFKRSPFGHNWILILSKLIRALHSPYTKDHWKDISGYATLISNWLEERISEEDQPF